ncbi:MAG: hypothetical protein C4550_04140 [Nitrospiraceae bacterium]|nr:MAG: hypothetical protein C4550_04140 [Nitrospiraceae bacterium]
MVIVSRYRLVEKSSGNIFSVLSEECIPCPCCGEHLSSIGSRKRKYRKPTGDVIVLVIRRLRCGLCRRIHHELPDMLVPYKRYGAASIEAVVCDGAGAAVAVDNSTVCRWLSWFSWAVEYMANCLLVIAYRYGLSIDDSPYTCQFSRLIRFVGNAPGWLSRSVRSVANSNLWVHTRSAFVSTVR